MRVVACTAVALAAVGCRQEQPRGKDIVNIDMRSLQVVGTVDAPVTVLPIRGMSYERNGSPADPVATFAVCTVGEADAASSQWAEPDGRPSVFAVWPDVSAMSWIPDTRQVAVFQPQMAHWIGKRDRAAGAIEGSGFDVGVTQSVPVDVTWLHAVATSSGGFVGIGRDSPGLRDGPRYLLQHGQGEGRRDEIPREVAGSLVQLHDNDWAVGARGGYGVFNTETVEWSWHTYPESEGELYRMLGTLGDGRPVSVSMSGNDVRIGTARIAGTLSVARGCANGHGIVLERDGGEHVFWNQDQQNWVDVSGTIRGRLLESIVRGDGPATIVISIDAAREELIVSEVRWERDEIHEIHTVSLQGIVGEHIEARSLTQ